MTAEMYTDKLISPVNVAIELKSRYNKMKFHSTIFNRDVKETVTFYLRLVRLSKHCFLKVMTIIPGPSNSRSFTTVRSVRLIKE